MKTHLQLLIILLLCSALVHAQTPPEIITRVLKAQASIQSITYDLTRRDTLVNDGVRDMSGSALILTDTADSIFGFKFKSRRNLVNSEIVYDGRLAYETNDETRQYTLISDRREIEELKFHAGGQVLMPDLVRLDTTKANGLVLTQDNSFYFLKITYPDLTKYDVTNRYKLVKIEKNRMLPLAVRHHQETLDKVQDLSYQITRLEINEPSFAYDFSNPPFLKTFTQKIATPSPNHPIQQLKGKAAPAFKLKSFAGDSVSSTDFKGQVTLLDFWEVWCGPCVESMPKIQTLHAKYKEKGLVVYGIVNDLKQLGSSRKFVEKRPEISFPMLIGNPQLMKDYLLEAVPMYVLIGRDGKVCLLSLGYPADLEAAIERAMVMP